MRWYLLKMHQPLTSDEIEAFINVNVTCIGTRNNLVDR